MRFLSRVQKIVPTIAVFFLVTWHGHAFALLGPFQPWMQPTNGLAEPGDIGGPMPIGSGYRWNVPVVTYGFDKSFLDFFGTNGEAAVESAIQVINNLPPASQMDLTNYAFDSLGINPLAEGLNLNDLKSTTLSLLLEHLGLASPTRYVFALNGWDSSLFDYNNGEFLSDQVDSNSNILNFLIERNYDPSTLAPSQYVNDTFYGYDLVSWLAGYDGNLATETIIEPLPVDPYAPAYDAVADFSLSVGTYYSGLTRDDVGGLRYLLSTNNIAYETLLPGVFGAGTNANSFVNGALRPGVDQFSFIPQPVDPASGDFLPTTNYYTDTYISNGVVMHQELARVISTPDFIFSAGDVNVGIPAFPAYGRTGTTNWVNNAAANGNSGGSGPGIIQPPVQIVFNKLGPQYSAGGSIPEDSPYDQSGYWASFDGSTNLPVVYPIPQTGTNQLLLRLWFWLPARHSQQDYVWKRCSISGTQYKMQTSTDLVNWTTLFDLTNNGTVCTYVETPSSTSRFYRLTP